MKKKITGKSTLRHISKDHSLIIKQIYLGANFLLYWLLFSVMSKQISKNKKDNNRKVLPLYSHFHGICLFSLYALCILISLCNMTKQIFTFQ